MTRIFGMTILQAVKGNIDFSPLSKLLFASSLTINKKLCTTIVILSVVVFISAGVILLFAFSWSASVTVGDVGSAVALSRRNSGIFLHMHTRSPPPCEVVPIILNVSPPRKYMFRCNDTQVSDVIFQRLQVAFYGL